MNPRSELRAFVQQSGVSVKQLAAAMGMSRQYLYMLMDEDSPHLPTRSKAAIIEEFSGIPRAAWESLYVPQFKAA